MKSVKKAKLLSALPPNAKKLASSIIGLNDADSGRHQGSGKKTTSNINTLKKILETRDASQEDVNTIKAMLPELSMIERILVSLVLSPNDMSNDAIDVTSTLSDSNVLEALGVIKKTLVDTYKINTLAEDILTESLFGTGSYPVIIMPEGNIQSAIRNGMVDPDNYSVSAESFTRNDFMGRGKNTTPSTLEGELALECVADPNYVYFSRHREIEKTNLMRKMYSDMVGGTGLTMESTKVEKRNDVVDIVMNASKKFEEMEELSLTFEVEDGSGKTGYASMLHPTSRSVIPIVSTSNPDAPICYYVLLDNDGRPIAPMDSSHIRDSFQSASEEEMDAIYKSLGNKNRERSKTRADDMSKMYEKAFNQTMGDWLKNSLMYGDVEVDLSLDQAISETLLWRSMKKRKTKVVLIPSKFMTYFAFSHNSQGIGTSLIQNNIIPATEYATLLYAYNLAAIKNSTIRRKIVIDLSADDPDPESTVNDIVDQTVKNLTKSVTPSSLSPDSINESLQSMGISVEVNSNGADYPDTKVDVQSQSESQGSVDNELLTFKRNRFIISFWISPNWVDMSSPVEFSRSITNESLLTAKRVAILQGRFEPMLTDMVRKILSYSPSIRDILPATYKNNPKKFSELIQSINIELPKANVNRYEQHAEMISTYVDLIDTVLDTLLDRDISAVAGDSNFNPDVTRSILKRMLLRQFMRQHDILPELLVFFEVDDETIKQAGADVKLTRKFAKKLAKMMEVEEVSDGALPEADANSDGDTSAGDDVTPVEDGVSEEEEVTEDGEGTEESEDPLA